MKFDKKFINTRITVLVVVAALVMLAIMGRAIYTATVQNEFGTELPMTGGIGTVIFYVLGSILVIGGGIYFISRRRAMK